MFNFSSFITIINTTLLRSYFYFTTKIRFLKIFFSGTWGNIKLNLYNLFPLLFADYLCPAEANVYGIDFTRFKLRDIDTKTVLFEVAKPENTGGG